jgi:hypothetical protein
MDSTRTPAPAGAPTTRAPSPFSAASALGDITAAAIERGKLERLNCADGTWMCWGCGAEYAPFHVSLHCEWCLQQARGRRVEWLLREARRSPEDRRWEAMALVMAKDSRLDRDGAVRLLEKARALPSKTPERMDALNLAFDRRFDTAAPGAHWGTYASHAAKESKPGRYVVDYDDPAEEWARG